MKNSALIKSSLVVLSIIALIVACTSSDSGTTGSTVATTCTLDDNTTTLSTNSNGCDLVSRDTSSCRQSRVDQGLDGFWLNFSCRVTLTVSGSNVTVTTDGQPDHTSNYFETSNLCYEDNQPSGRFQNPNNIAVQSVSMTVPLNPTSSSPSSMSLGVVGIAVNGVVIYSNEAAPGDSIYAEVDSFDYCEGHPDSGGNYHYHTEPPSITSSDSNFVGVLRDGNPVYGIQNEGGGTPTLDSQGGESGTTPDSTSPIYHYHVYQQTESSPPFRNAYFITSGTYAGPIGTCTGC